MLGAGGREVAGPEEYDMALSVACSPCPVTKGSLCTLRATIARQRLYPAAHDKKLHLTSS